MDDYKYAIEWFAYGFNDPDEDYIVKFMMYWIAFNWLYNEYHSKYVQEELKQYVFSEREKIEAFCDAKMHALPRYDSFNHDDVKVFLDRPIEDGVTRKPHNKTFNGLSYGIDSVKMKNLLLTIYHVRCNMFHGSKSIYNLRDRGLVKASANILEKCLKALLPPEQLEAKLSKRPNL